MSALLEFEPDFADCVAPLLSCRGTLIVHVDEFAECTDDPECLVPRLAHDFTARCEDATCCCW